jgi:hypothetical protein
VGSGETEREANIAVLTVKDADPVTLADAAEMVTVPLLFPVANPALSIVAAALLALHATALVRSCELPSLN